MSVIHLFSYSSKSRGAQTEILKECIRFKINGNLISYQHCPAENTVSSVASVGSEDLNLNEIIMAKRNETAAINHEKKGFLLKPRT